MESPSISTYIFDLDVTLTDSWSGIRECVWYACDQLGIERPDATAMKPFAGPPLHLAFAWLLNTQDKNLIRQACHHYRTHYVEHGKGLAENKLYLGVTAMLTTLHQGGIKLFVATAKPEPLARDVLTHFDIAHLFEEIRGRDGTGAFDNKGDLLADIVRLHDLDPASTAMVGDREHDMHAAYANRMQAIGVLWGYGSADELRAAGAHRLVKETSEIATHAVA